MIKYGKFASFSVVLLMATAAGLTAYLVRSLPFEQRVDCATGEAGYGFLPAACRAHIKAFATGETPEMRQKLSENLHRLVSAYDLGQGGLVGENALKLADQFIQLGADVNHIDLQGGTPLHTAVLHGDIRLVQFLLDRGADATKRSRVEFLGMTLSPLELAQSIKQSGNTDQKWSEIIGLLKSQSPAEKTIS